MLGKTLMLGVISASAALGIVYFGTAPQGSEAAEAHPHDDVSVEKMVKTPNLAVRERIEPRLPTVRKADEDKREKLASNDGLSAVIADDATAEMDDANAMPQTESDAQQPKRQTRWLDQYLKKNKGDGSEAKEKSSKTASEDNRGGDYSSATGYSVSERDVIEDVEPDVLVEDAQQVDAEAEAETGADKTMTDSRIFRIEDGKLVEITPEGAVDFAQVTEAEQKRAAAEAADAEQRAAELKQAAKDKPSGFVYKAQETPSDTTPLLSTVMAEAGQIKKSELRDQAYFEITEYALSEGRYESARAAHDMISQEELSYTAKSRIAVAFAQNGMPTKAFKVIEEVDEAELRDFMRLQVIEALIAPQNLPEMWQEKNN